MENQAGVYVSMHCIECDISIDSHQCWSDNINSVKVSAGRQEVVLFLTDAQLCQIATYLAQLAQDRQRIAIERRGSTDQELAESM